MFNLNRMIQLTVALKSKLKRIKVNSNNQNIVSRCFLIWGCRNAKTLRNCSLSCETAYLPKYRKVCPFVVPCRNISLIQH
jgi:hypothetical protein